MQGDNAPAEGAGASAGSGPDGSTAEAEGWPTPSLWPPSRWPRVPRTGGATRVPPGSEPQVPLKKAPSGLQPAKRTTQKDTLEQRESLDFRGRVGLKASGEVTSPYPRKALLSLQESWDKSHLARFFRKSLGGIGGGLSSPITWSCCFPTLGLVQRTCV